MPTESGHFQRQLGTRIRTLSDSDGNFSIQGTTNVDEDGGIWSRTSVRTPSFKTAFLKKKKLDLPMNPFTYSNYRLIGGTGHRALKATNLTTGAWTLDEERGFYPYGGPSLLIDSNVLPELIIKASAKMRSGLKDQDVNLAVAIGEGRPTVNLIAQKAMQIARAGIAIRKFDFRGAATALAVSPRGSAVKRSRHQTLAQNWLELQYGWRPLLSDIYGAAQFLAKQNNWLPRSRLRASSSRTTGSSVKSIQDTTVYVSKRSDTYTATYVIYFTEPSGGNPASALGLTNPISVAWELVPFSFVADWFLPLGDYFNNIDSTLGRTFVKGCLTEFWRGQISTFGYGIPPFVVGNTRYEPLVREDYRSTAIFCRRTVLTDFPSNRFPRFKNPFSGIHAANALALIAQVFSGSPVRGSTRI